MSEGYTEFVDIDVQAWVNAAQNNPVLYRDRQATEIVLTAIGLSPRLSDSLYLKGGTLMGLVFSSERLTKDVDFTSEAEPEEFLALINEDLDNALAEAARKLGYLDLVCKIQTIEKHPRPQNFQNADFPALLIKIAHAKSGTREEDALRRGVSNRVLYMEVTFRDRVYDTQGLCLTDAGVYVQAFSRNELIAEKLRALLQQPVRNRNRRQDIFDIRHLLEMNEPTAADRFDIRQILERKAEGRHVVPARNSLRDSEVRSRAQREWETLQLEIGDLPDFDESYAIVTDFYERLPW